MNPGTTVLGQRISELEYKSVNSIRNTPGKEDKPPKCKAAH